MVIPGGITYNPKYDAGTLAPNRAVSIFLCIDQLVGKSIRGEISGVRAKVIDYLLPPSEGVANPTIFVTYTDSGSDDEVCKFADNEALINESQ